MLTYSLPSNMNTFEEIMISTLIIFEPKQAEFSEEVTHELFVQL